MRFLTLSDFGGMDFSGFRDFGDFDVFGGDGFGF